MVDAPASGAGVCMDVEVRVLSWAPANLQMPYLYRVYWRFMTSCVPLFNKMCTEFADTIPLYNAPHILKNQN